MKAQTMWGGYFVITEGKEKKTLFLKDYVAFRLKISVKTVDRMLSKHPEIHRETVHCKRDGRGATHPIYLDYGDYLKAARQRLSSNRWAALTDDHPLKMDWVAIFGDE